MATKLKISHVGDTLTWVDRVAGRVAFTFDMTTVAMSLRDAVFAYGCKQILSDAGAKHSPGSIAWQAALGVRAEALVAGTWGQRAPSMPDYDVWSAMLALGKVVDSDANREVWRGMKPRERAVLRALPDVAEWLAENAPADDDAEALLELFTG